MGISRGEPEFKQSGSKSTSSLQLLSENNDVVSLYYVNIDDDGNLLTQSMSSSSSSLQYFNRIQSVIRYCYICSSI